jgi:hypothetical protein
MLRTENSANKFQIARKQNFQLTKSFSVALLRFSAYRISETNQNTTFDLHSDVCFHAFTVSDIRVVLLFWWKFQWQSRWTFNYNSLLEFNYQINRSFLSLPNKYRISMFVKSQFTNSRNEHLMLICFWFDIEKAENFFCVLSPTETNYLFIFSLSGLSRISIIGTTITKHCCHKHTHTQTHT